MTTPPASTPTASPASAAADSPAIPPAPVVPSVHVRAVITWLAIFPLVLLAMTITTPLSADWHPILRSLVLTLIVVPIAVYLVVPQLLRAYVALVGRRRRERGDA